MQDQTLPQPDPRAEFVAGLRALADFYEANPTMPVPLYPQLLVGCSNGGKRDDDAAAELVRHAAELLDVEATESRGGGWNAHRNFGPLDLDVYCTTRERMARHHAETSYVGAVQPEGGVS